MIASPFPAIRFGALPDQQRTTGFRDKTVPNKEAAQEYVPHSEHF